MMTATRIRLVAVMLAGSTTVTSAQTLDPDKLKVLQSLRDMEFAGCEMMFASKPTSELTACLNEVMLRNWQTMNLPHIDLAHIMISARVLWAKEHDQGLITGAELTNRERSLRAWMNAEANRRQGVVSSR